MLVLLGAVGSIILVDLLLSGDNALVIGAAAAGLPRRQRWLAILVGGAAAVLLRIVFSLLSTVLLNLPWLQTAGAVVLLVIAIRLLADRKSNTTEKEGRGTSDATTQHVQQGLVAAMLTILVADVTMSLDNILAVGALANGNIPLLVVGLLVSVAILLFGSALIAEVVGRLTLLLDVAALVLAWTGANMIIDDLRQNSTAITLLPWLRIAIPATTLTIVIIFDIWLRVHDARTSS